MLNWTKAIFLILAPLLILLVGVNAAVIAGGAIAFFGQSTNNVWNLWGFIPLPETTRDSVNAALLVVNIGALIIFLWRLRVPLYAARQNKMSLKRFALLPLQDRRSLIQAVARRPSP
jgi:hypothetical protein